MRNKALASEIIGDVQTAPINAKGNTNIIAAVSLAIIEVAFHDFGDGFTKFFVQKIIVS